MTVPPDRTAEFVTDVPAAVLSGSVEERCEWYDQRILEHDRLEAVTKELRLLLHPDHPCLLIALRGPTGVGKTTLLSKLAAGFPWATPRDRVPVVSLSCPAPERRGFEFGKPYWRLLLERMRHPAPADVFDPAKAARRRQEGKEWPATGRHATSDDLRVAALKGFSLLGVRAVFLDEAQHVLKVAGARRLADQMDVIKDIIDVTGVKHLLSGAELLPGLAVLNGQLARRTRVVKFDAYNFAVEDDQTAFNNMFAHLVMKLPVREQVPLNGLFEPMFEHSAGCAGIMKDILSAALLDTLLEGKECVTAEALEREWQRLRTDGQAAEFAHSVSKFREPLSLPWNGSPRSCLGMPHASGTGKPATSGADRKSNRKGARKGGRKGVRKPKRDPVKPPAGRASA